MSARLSFALVAGLWLSLISACDKAPTSVADDVVRPVVREAEPEAAPLVSQASTAAEVESFVLDSAVKPGATLSSLRKQYGDANVVAGELPGAEGETAEGWIIFPKDPEKKLMIYTDESNSHPGSLLVDEANSKWHLSNSIKIGTDSTTLQSLNKKPFTFYGFYWDYGGVITEWNGGELSKKTANGAQVNIHLCPPENSKLPDNYLMGDGTFNSDNPLAVKFPPVVCKLGVYFPVEEKL